MIGVVVGCNTPTTSNGELPRYDSILNKCEEAANTVFNGVTDAHKRQQFKEAVSENVMGIPFDTLAEQLGDIALGRRT